MRHGPQSERGNIHSGTQDILLNKKMVTTVNLATSLIVYCVQIVGLFFQDSVPDLRGCRRENRKAFKVLQVGENKQEPAEGKAMTLNWRALELGLGTKVG